MTLNSIDAASNPAGNSFAAEKGSCAEQDKWLGLEHPKKLRISDFSCILAKPLPPPTVAVNCRLGTHLTAIAVRPFEFFNSIPAMPSPSIEEYRVRWVCALPKEMAAARAMLDQEHGPMPAQNAQDCNNYMLGRVHNHNVVIACLPAGVDGNNAAAVVVMNMLRTFTSLRFGLIVGGIPNLDKGLDIRLGDVVVSQPDKTHGGVIQYDKGKSLRRGTI